MKNCILRALFMAAVLVVSAHANADAYQTFKSKQDAASAFAYLHQVTTHPRCANCHGVVEDNVHFPTVGEERRRHPMGITTANNVVLALVDGKFIQPGTPHPLNCRNCHQNTNGTEPGMPPGAASEQMPGFIWHMPPPTMAIPPGMSAASLCEHWLDPASNSFLAMRGGRNDMKTFAKEFTHHAEEDPLVQWSWAPGPGREPAPGSHHDFVEAMKIWIEGGAPCPAD